MTAPLDAKLEEANDESAATLAPAPTLASGAAGRTASVVAIAVSAMSAVAPPIKAAGRENEDEPTRIGASPKPEPLAAVEVVLVLDMVVPPNES